MPRVTKNAADRVVDGFVADYFNDLAAQTRGSHRRKRANDTGQVLTIVLRLMDAYGADKSLAGYIARAQERLSLIRNSGRKNLPQDQRVAIFRLLLERMALENVHKLDQLESVGAISRMRRCSRCQYWFWGRVESQRYCSAKCRIKHFQASPEGKKYKREWARNDYQRNKDLDRKAVQYATRGLSMRTVLSKQK